MLLYLFHSTITGFYKHYSFLFSFPALRGDGLCLLLEYLVALFFNSGIYLLLNSPLYPFICFCLLAFLFLFFVFFPSWISSPFALYLYQAFLLLHPDVLPRLRPFLFGLYFLFPVLSLLFPHLSILSPLHLHCSIDYSFQNPPLIQFPRTRYLFLRFLLFFSCSSSSHSYLSFLLLALPPIFSCLVLRSLPPLLGICLFH